MSRQNAQVADVHGAIAAASRTQKKLEARLDIRHLQAINKAARVPLVLHGGTGIPKAYVQEAVGHGIAKVNVATAIRQPYERCMAESVPKAQQAVYEETVRTIREELGIEGSAARLFAVQSTQEARP